MEERNKIMEENTKSEKERMHGGMEGRENGGNKGKERRR